MSREAEKPIKELGDDSGLFEKEDDLSYGELGELRDVHEFGAEAWVEEYEYEHGFIVYNLENRRIYGDREGAFRTARILALRERMLNDLMGSDRCLDARDAEGR